jgi:hypothetical protein
MKRNDDDMKIFHPRKSDAAGGDLMRLVALTDIYRRNGNMQKAIDIGEKLACVTPEEAFPEDTVRLKSKELMQLRALMSFSAQIALQKYMPHSMLATQAVNAMFMKLSETSPGIFANISDGSSFTFYYLSLRKQENIEEEIGKNYAMLCERVGDEWFSDLGSKVYVETDMYVCNLIERYEFEE